ncbi:hypothetical protein [Streptomyces olivaceus]|uniref:hypothetical protein n=1 Tax=Streptomyces olivaceus TaxID=47716 RepID=UPI001CCD15B9|nr:hypothetical protein [Streptomyces olivaceus]MBZ6139913.1 hypothetical protein [Streptomyces olivaceus]MBZ6166182.1 hypothetical protein [Streptomyces olivaceus]
MRDTWSDSPFMSRAELSSTPEGAVISRDNGESRLVYEIEGSPGWLAKLYKQPAGAGHASDLRRLVCLPAGMPQADQALVNRCASWPTTRLFDGPDLVGVVMAKAPDGFYAPLRALSGWQEPVPLPLDWLMKSPDDCARVGLRRPDRGIRLRVVEELLAVGELFARHGIVYGDWSYRNALWNQHTGEVFVIDMDSCGFGTRDWVESLGWADPLFPDRARRPTVASDAYKLAVMTVRCLTARRQDPIAALRTMESAAEYTSLTALLRRSLTAARPEDRPECRELLDAVRRIRGTPAPADRGSGAGSTAGAGNVTTWVKVGPKAGSDAGTRGTNGSKASNVTGEVNLRGRSPRRPPAPPRAAQADAGTDGSGPGKVTGTGVSATLPRSSHIPNRPARSGLAPAADPPRTTVRGASRAAARRTPRAPTRRAGTPRPARPTASSTSGPVWWWYALATVFWGAIAALYMARFVLGWI